jgi:(1->4)-alpha-D-glucan 1-alpha-D-glucosylmutase
MSSTGGDFMVRIPSSTYRLQLHRGFTFDDAAGIAEYLCDLGIWWTMRW